ncbi:hypothetical protein SRHO_G00124880 [Serrasalmus rhombeus]
MQGANSVWEFSDCIIHNPPDTHWSVRVSPALRWIARPYRFGNKNQTNTSSSAQSQRAGTAGGTGPEFTQLEQEDTSAPPLLQLR